MNPDTTPPVVPATSKTEDDNATTVPDESEVDDALEESFPASDPPFWTLGVDAHHHGTEEQTGDEPVLPVTDTAVGVERPLG